MAYVYIDGVWDLFHYGHMTIINRLINKYGAENIIVGVVSDKDCESYKRTPILDLQTRKKTIECFNQKLTVIDAELQISHTFIQKHDIGKIIHGDDSTQHEFFKIPIELGIMEYLPYTVTISTSDIIDKVLNRKL